MNCLIALHISTNAENTNLSVFCFHGVPGLAMANR